MTETVAQKAERILADGRLTVTRVSASAELAKASVVATCRGDHGEYVLGYDAVAREWRCTCESRKRCSHILALQKVTKVKETE